MVHLNVKWGKEMFRDVEADTEQPPLVFKSQLYTLSGVPPERCKVMFRGKLLGDESWEGFKLKEGQQIMMMGSSEATSVVTAPQVTPVFLEDLPEEEQDGAPLAIYGAGLKNLGNTCYMNSTLQCLYAVPELRASLVKFVPRGAGLDPSEQLTAEVARLFGDIEQAKGPVLPARFLLTLRNSFPQFAEVGDGGVYKQQDAEECWSQVMQALGEKLREGEEPDKKVIEELFGVNFFTKLKCKESDEEIVTQTGATKLQCVIPIGGRSVSHLHEGIEESLKADREQMSPKLGRNALYEGSAEVTRLPPYMVVQMVRFFYKRTAQQKAKILKQVSFPATLDAYNFCSSDLKAQLNGPRNRVKELQDAALDSSKASGSGVDDKKEEGTENGEPPAPTEDVVMEDATEPEPSAAMSKESEMLGTGMYELFALLTHKGRSADSGHYVGWAKQADGEWIQYDDETMKPVREEEIMQLNGGGDWHMAYLLLYRAKTVDMGKPPGGS